MSHFIARPALPEELEKVYVMGYDSWSEGASMKDYLNTCHNSPKYKNGTWYVLVDKDQVLSSLIAYDLGENRIGFGSIATPIEWRKRGFASMLIKSVMEILDKEKNNPSYLLYSDISPVFYEPFGFSKLQPELQKYPKSVCMMKPGKNRPLLNEQNLPKYF